MWALGLDGAGDAATFGDLLVAAGSRELTTTDELFDVLADLDSGELAVNVVRGSAELSVTVTFPAADAPAPGE